MQRVEETFENYHTIYEDEEGNRISKNKMIYYKGPLFKCLVAEGTRFQIEKVR